MKILHITNAYPTDTYGSFGIFIKEQIESLNNLGIQNDVVFINAYEKGNKEYFKYLIKLLGRYKDYDIVHCHHSYSGIIYLITSVFNRKPLVFSNLGDINKQRRGIDRYFFNLISKRAKVVIYKNDMKLEDYDKKRFYYLPNGVNTDFFKPADKSESKKQLGLDADKKYALFVSASGTKSRVKRYDKFLETLSLLSERGVILEPLVMSGVERGKVPLYFNAAEIMILTSDHEGSPNAVKEAMACDLPVVSTNVGNVKKMLEGCLSSFTAESNTAEELCELAEKSMSITARTERKTIIQKKLDIKSVAKELSKIYKSILEKGKK